MERLGETASIKFVLLILNTPTIQKECVHVSLGVVTHVLMARGQTQALASSFDQMN